MIEHGGNFQIIFVCGAYFGLLGDFFNPGLNRDTSLFKEKCTRVSVKLFAATGLWAQRRQIHDGLP